MKKIGEVTFLETKCEVIKTYYVNNSNNAIDLIEKETGEPFLSASTNFSYKLNEDEVLIKNYSENYGIREVLMDNKIISKPLEFNINGLDITKHKIYESKR